MLWTSLNIKFVLARVTTSRFVKCSRDFSNEVERYWHMTCCPITFETFSCWRLQDIAISKKCLDQLSGRIPSRNGKRNSTLGTIHDSPVTNNFWPWKFILEMIYSWMIASLPPCLDEVPNWKMFLNTPYKIKDQYASFSIISCESTYVIFSRGHGSEEWDCSTAGSRETIYLLGELVPTRTSHTRAER